ncbi:MAG: hypothetical protein ACI9EQ_002085 [Bacteroidia bacterium]|jgi:hypothetical protein
MLSFKSILVVYRLGKMQVHVKLCQVFFQFANPIEIKRSSGLKRGKSDKADAFEIARYAWLHRDELDSSEPTSEQLIELQRMMAFRTQLVKQMTALKNQKSGMKVVSDSPPLAQVCNLCVINPINQP